MNYVDKLIHYLPGAAWYADGDTYEGIVWQDESPQPSKSELDALPWPPEPSTDPADYPLLPWQFKVMVDVLDVDAAIRAAIDDIEDVWQRAVAMRRYTDATAYEWSDPLLQQIRAAIGMSEQDLASHWMVAKDLRSA